MKNTWIHSAVLIVIATFVLVLAQKFSTTFIDWIVDSGANSPTASSLLAPIEAFSILAPGLLLGWFTRRHPLVVGAIAGALATFAASKIFGSTLNSHLLLGEVIAVAMIVAVAALAGRALRYRFRPSS